MGIIPRKPCVKSDQIKFSKEVEGDINFGLPFKVNSITLWPGEVSGFRQSAHFTHRPLYIIYPGFFTSTLILIFIADPFSCKTYDQHIKSSWTSFLNLWFDLQKIIWRWNTACWRETFVWVFPSFQSGNIEIAFWKERKVYILVIWCFARGTFGEKKIPHRLPRQPRIQPSLFYILGFVFIKMCAALFYFWPALSLLSLLCE